MRTYQKRVRSPTGFLHLLPFEFMVCLQNTYIIQTAQGKSYYNLSNCCLSLKSDCNIFCNQYFMLTGQYLNLDKDHNGMLSKEELSRYGTGTLTSVFLDRVYQECLTYDGEMVKPSDFITFNL